MRIAKPKWMDADVTLFGTDLQLEIDEAMVPVTDPFIHVEKLEGIHVWRIWNTKFVHWPAELNGHFFENDVFLVLNNQNKECHAHIWVGRGASEEDYISGLYMSTELDEALGYTCNVHRDVQGYEHQRFRDYFNPMTVHWGSASEHYFHEKNEQPRLYKMFQPNPTSTHTKIKQVPLNKSQLVHDNVMILDVGRKIYVWVGPSSSKNDIIKAQRYAMLQKANRGTKTDVVTVHKDSEYQVGQGFDAFIQDDENEENGAVDSEDENLRQLDNRKSFTNKLFLATSYGGRVKLTEKKKGKITMKDFKGQNSVLFLTSNHLFVWVQRKAANDESKLAMEYAHEFLRSLNGREFMPVTVVKEGSITEDFKKQLA